MKIKEAKKFASDNGCELWWDAKLQLWTVMRTDRRVWSGGYEARYVTASSLRNMDTDTFGWAYLELA